MKAVAGLGLRKRVHELYAEFTRDGKYEHRNELVLLLNESLRKQLKIILVQSLGSGLEEE